MGLIWSGTIDGTPITKKNSQQIRRNSRTGRPFISQSSRYQDFETAALWQLKGSEPDEPICVPVRVEEVFFVPDKRRRDLTNLEEAVDDILVAAGVLKDDCWAILDNHDGSHVQIDKDNPRVEIKIYEAKKRGIHND